MIRKAAVTKLHYSTYLSSYHFPKNKYNWNNFVNREPNLHFFKKVSNIWNIESDCELTEWKSKNVAHDITKSLPLKNVARENATEPEQRKKACVTSCRPVNLTVNHVIPRVRRVRKYCFLLRQSKHSVIHRRRIAVILIGRYCLKIDHMQSYLFKQSDFFIKLYQNLENLS